MRKKKRKQKKERKARPQKSQQNQVLLLEKSNVEKATKLEPLITSHAPTDKRNKVKFEMVLLTDAIKMAEVGAKCYTEILQKNGTERKITYFNSPDKAIKEREKTNSTGHIWIEHADTKDIAYIVNKQHKPI